MCVVVLSACSNSGPAQPVSSPVRPQPQTEMTTTALTVSSVNPPIRLVGSDGKTHLEYDLILQSMFNVPVTVTSIEVLGSDGASLLKLDGDEVVKVTTPAFTGPPTAVVAPSAAVGTVIDVVVPSDNVPERSTIESATARAHLTSGPSWGRATSSARSSMSTHGRPLPSRRR
ncbi:MAG TPA: hypothetical protein VE666_04850 [Mycobacterium sp.]|jgi:hypothetical protein|nr:hypothetical protein [Mycobacterium sp.]